MFAGAGYDGDGGALEAAQGAGAGLFALFSEGRNAPVVDVPKKVQVLLVAQVPGPTEV
jgi:hypothetical protein